MLVLSHRRTQVTSDEAPDTKLSVGSFPAMSEQLFRSR